MKLLRKIECYLAVTMMIIVTFASVVGYQSTQTTEKNEPSPLFRIRTRRAIEKTSERNMISAYLGKGNTLSLFTISKSKLDVQCDKAMKLINNNPVLLHKLLSSIARSPQMIHFFQQHGLSMTMIKQTLAYMKENPQFIQNQLNTHRDSLDIENPPQPLGMDTSSAIGCFVTILVVLPLGILLSVIVATILIVTCFNIGNCFETIFQAIVTGMIQGLHEPYTQNNPLMGR